MSKVNFCNVVLKVQGSEALANKACDILESLQFIEKNGVDLMDADDEEYYITLYQYFTIEQLKIVQDTLISAGFRF